MDLQTLENQSKQCSGYPSSFSVHAVNGSAVPLLMLLFGAYCAFSLPQKRAAIYIQTDVEICHVYHLQLKAPWNCRLSRRKQCENMAQALPGPADTCHTEGTQAQRVAVAVRQCQEQGSGPVCTHPAWFHPQNSTDTRAPAVPIQHLQSDQGLQRTSPPIPF